MFDLTNEQRKCFALSPVLNIWKKVRVKASPYDTYDTYAYLEGQKIVKVIEVSGLSGQERYREYDVDQLLSEDGTKLLPKTDKGKPQNFTSSNLIKKTPIGMSFCYVQGNLLITNETSKQCYYRSAYNSIKLENLSDLSKFVDEWCHSTGEKEFSDINDFAKKAKVLQKFREGDFFRYRINRGLYGYGRILVDYAKMRKDGVPFWDFFMGKPLCVAVYHIVTEDRNLTPAQLVNLKMLPSQMIMDNIFYYSECEIIGNIPISANEDNYTIHYGEDIDVCKPNYLCYQCGKTFVTLEGVHELDLYKGNIYGGFRNGGIGWGLDISLPILLECIKKKSNAPYWSMIPSYKADIDLRNPKLKRALKKIKKQMGIK